MVSHAANPFAEPLSEERLLVYFSCRDSQNRSSIGSVEVNLGDLSTSNVSTKPWLTPGERGAFDDSGVSLGCIVKQDCCRYLYYLGWNLSVTVPFRNSIGLAISRGAGPFERVSRAPILDRSNADPFGLSYPWVECDDQGWQMWYGSTTSWNVSAGTVSVGDHVIKHARSEDGIHWQPSADVCVGASRRFPASAYSRPCVLRANGAYRMWYSYRSAGHYRIGCAESEDCLEWRPASTSGPQPSGKGWDSDAAAYPHVFRHSGRLHVVYCGNGYGESGFGLATEAR